MPEAEPDPDSGLDLTTQRSWPEPQSKVQHLTDWASQVPHIWIILNKLIDLELLDQEG